MLHHGITDARKNCVAMRSGALALNATILIRGFVMNDKANRCVTNLLAGITALAVPFFSVSAQAQSQPFDSTQTVAYQNNYLGSDAFTRKFYGGIGFGMSWLEPDTTEAPSFDPNKRVNPAGQLTLGFDLNKWLSLEGHATTLGEAGLAPTGTIGYQTVGLSALAYAGKSRHRYNRRGLSFFGRAGYGYLQNEPSSEIPFQKVNATHFLLGAGVEYSTRMGLGVRAEGIAFDADIRYGQLSLLYRFGKQKQRRRELVVQAPAPTVEPTALLPLPVPAVAVAPADSDADGVYDSLDNCPGSPAEAAVDSVGCALFNGVIEGVNFNSGSAELTPNAQTILSGVVSTLGQYPNVKLTIMAHTDSQGDDVANKELSKQRARSVAVYLVRNGIPAQRLSARGYGEAQPIDTNETAEGRLRNRRVEFRAAQ